MSTKSTIYTNQCIAGAGFAVMNSAIAWRLRPDLWGSAQNCAMDLMTVKHEGAKRLSVALQGVGKVLVLAMSEKRLAERIEEVTGLAVISIEPFQEPTQAAPAAQPITTYARKHHDERMEKLHKLAAMDPPIHHCALRTDILRAKEELLQMGLLPSD